MQLTRCRKSCATLLKNRLDVKRLRPDDCAPIYCHKNFIFYFRHFVISGNMDRKNVIEALSAIAHDQRLSIFRLLVNAEPDGLLAGEIAACLEALPNTVSSNLSILAATGLITSVREGRSIRYRAELAAMGALITYLTDDCCNGRPELCFPRNSTKSIC